MIPIIYCALSIPQFPSSSILVQYTNFLPSRLFYQSSQQQHHHNHRRPGTFGGSNNYEEGGSSSSRLVGGVCENVNFDENARRNGQAISLRQT
mmetsp:Transcript_127/g.222  ORF Transcript_127/g.222 Transcript_127/m.222 type:complete len:93 (-) Transcript_127:74-352(-)